jgi:hypothetical protein
MCDSLKEMRRDLTLSELQRLAAELKRWYDRRVDADTYPNGKYRGQYETQLNAIVKEVEGAAAILSREIENLCLEQEIGAVYAACEKHDRCIVWLWRAWHYFREKFDQRDDPALQPALRAADEVVWSCYRPFFEGSNRPMQPAPLPYIEPKYSPAAVRRDSVRLTTVAKDPEVEGDTLTNAFATLPIPILQLPPTVVTAPWALVLIGHEVGHFIQPLIEPRHRFVGRFGEILASVAEQQRGNKTSWKNWSTEIFADWYSILTMGPWAIWVMGQFELVEESRMRTPRTPYPARLVRLVLMAELARGLGLVDSHRLLDQVFGANPLANGCAADVECDLAIARKAVDAILKPLPDGLGNLAELLSFRATDYQAAAGDETGGEVGEWAAMLQGEGDLPWKHQLRTARLVASGAAMAWSKIVGMSPSRERSQALESFRAKAFPTISNCCEEKKRAALTAPLAREGEPGAALARLLLEASDDQLYE